MALKVGPLGDRFDVLWAKVDAERARQATVASILTFIAYLGFAYLSHQSKHSLDGDCVRWYRHAFTAQDTAIVDRVAPPATPGVACGQRRKEIAARHAPRRSE